MSSGARDPHDDIDKLCDTIAVLMLSLNQHDLIDIPLALSDAVNLRLRAIKSIDPLDVVNAGVEVLMRSRVVH
jgi:hypothetical protein